MVTVQNKTLPTKLIIFDLDDTLLKRDTNEISNKQKSIITFVKERGFKVGLASLNCYAREILAKNGIQEYFDYIQHRTKETFNILNKSTMLQNILKELNVTADNTILFDDNYQHCVEAMSLGIKFVYVNKRFGVRWRDIKTAINSFN